MQLGSLELQIFVALFLVLGSAFVALVCDFLKGNNEQLRERNIELRVRQDERERLGLFEPLAHPITWLQGLAQLVRNPGLAEAAAAAPAGTTSASAQPPAAEADGPDLDNLTGAAASTPAPAASEADRNPQRRHRYDEFKAAAQHQSWATKEELEQLAGRAARIRARHEASQRKDELVVAPAAPATAAGENLEPAPRPRVAELPKLEQPKLAVQQPRPMPVVAKAKPVVEAPVETPIDQPETVVAEAKPVFEQAPVQAESTDASEAAPPPMLQNPATTAWTFAPSKAMPMESGTVTSADIPSLQVVRPEAPALVSSLPPIEEPMPEVAAEAVAVEPVVALPEVEPVVKSVIVPEPVVAEVSGEPVTPVVEAPVVAEVAEAFETTAPDVFVAEEVVGAPEAAVTPEPSVPPEAVEIPEVVVYAEETVSAPPVQEPAPVAAELAEPIRTRIQAIEIPPFSDFDSPEADTQDFAFPSSAPQAKQAEPAPVQPAATPEPVRAEVRPVEAISPALDVVALRKATGESQPAERKMEIPAEALVEAKLEIPAGLHEASVLSGLLENQSPYSGVVVAIGLNDYESLREKLSSGTDSVAALNKMVLSMLRPQDFACRFQDDEYILIYPNERGSSAQRRLFQVSEKLWDFQLRSLGNLSVMFSWGGLEVTNETLSEAVASARERMYQTKRNRKPSGLEFASGARKKVVNG